jgi:large repetitive protein
MKTGLPGVFLAVGLCALSALAMPDAVGLGTGRDGSLFVREEGKVINHYTQVMMPIAPGDTLVQVAQPESFFAGQLVMVLQVTGLVPEPRLGSSTPISLDQDAVGRWEWARLVSVEKSMLRLEQPLVHSYAAQVTQVLHVPEYKDVDIPRGASLRALPWDGTRGGVVAFLATGTVRNDGEIQATGAGFRGGSAEQTPFDWDGCVVVGSMARVGGPRGEGIAVTQYDPTQYGRERSSNGGGGGLCPMAGGGGGGNGGAGASGSTYGEPRHDENTELGGQGGIRLDYSLQSHLTFGGGGGMGHGQSGFVPDAGRGGGAIVIRTQELVGTGYIITDGESGAGAILGGSGGGGAGGSIYLLVENSNAVCGGVFARGGHGGSSSLREESKRGAGGGGGGGRILLKGSAFRRCLPSVSTGIERVVGTQASRVLNEGLIERLTLGTRKGVKITYPEEGKFVNRERLVIKACATDEDNNCLDPKSGGLDCVYSFTIAKGSYPVPGGNYAEYTPPPGFPDGTYQALLSLTCPPTAPPLNAEPVNFTFDSKGARTTITPERPRDAITPDRTAVFQLLADEPIDHFECSLDPKDEPEFDGCTTPIEFRKLGPGRHKLYVRAIDKALNKEEAPPHKDWEIKPLDTVITSHPPEGGKTKETSAIFSFSFEGAANSEDYANEVSYECALGKNLPLTGFKPCVSGEVFDLKASGDGRYYFSVFAKHKKGTAVDERDVSPAEFSWSIDNTAPSVKILVPSEQRKVKKLDFTGSVDEVIGDVHVVVDGILTVGEKTKEIGDGRWAITSDTPIEDGCHSAVVTATDSVGITGDSEVRRFVFDTQPPSRPIITGPPRTVNSRIATFEFKSIDAVRPECEDKSKAQVKKFECRLDGNPDDNGSTVPCGSVYPVSGLDEGEHLLEVFAVDEAGNVSDTATHVWTVSIRLPDAPVVTVPANGAIVDTQTPIIEGTAVAGSTVTIYVDGKEKGVALADDNGNWSFRLATDLALGEHRLTTDAVDKAGNHSPQQSAAHVFTIFIAPESSHVIGGGVNCSSTGPQPSGLWWLLSGLAWWNWRQRRSDRLIEAGTRSSAELLSKL